METLVAIFGVASAGVVLPAIVRLCRRRSAADYSVWSLVLAVSCQVVWLVYAFYHDLPAMKVGGAAWLTVLTTQTALVLRWRNHRA